MIRASIAVLCCALLLPACGYFGSKDVKNTEAPRIRADLAALEADGELASRAPLAMKDAEAAVAAAEQSQSAAAAAYLGYMADRKVKLARALAEARLADDRLRALTSGPAAN